MLRAMGAAVVGYVVIGVSVVVGVAALWASLGSHFAFAGDSTTASTKWSLIMVAVGLVAAMLGGRTAAKLGGPVSGRAVRILAILVIVLGTAQWVTQAGSEREPLPAGKTVHDLTFTEAGRYAVSPAWYNATIILVGVAGVLIGGNCCCAPGKE